MTVAEVAKHLRVNPKWVYAHQQELGAIKLSDGPRARLRLGAAPVEGGLVWGGRERDGVVGVA